MYADRVEAGDRLSVRDRLIGKTVGGSARRRQITGKRLREDDTKWEHDLYEQDETQISSRKLGAKDLRLKLQRRSTVETSRGLNKSISRGTRDLREKLSGTVAAAANISKTKTNSEVSKPLRKSGVAEALKLETKKVASTTSKKKSQQKAESVDSFLQSLGLEKYAITFQAEEVDMAALIHMTDEDLKAMGIPMGPRKKIVLALESKH
ncbi:unnamed protein product [Cuscuta epithymum]|uniref:SAM domain-containing protein n=1 Tax=Cuscuta epithymum TaxID=186058 RepID=A0AAV0CG33_9ASTE|nr:unnamed protein product [Cuscuta epithymum]